MRAGRGKNQIQRSYSGLLPAYVRLPLSVEHSRLPVTLRGRTVIARRRPLLQAASSLQERVTNLTQARVVASGSCQRAGAENRDEVGDEVRDQLKDEKESVNVSNVNVLNSLPAEQ